MNPNWRIFTGQFAGVRNKLLHRGMQDHSCTFLKRQQKVFAVVMADGASCAKYANEGAKSLVKGIREKIFESRSSSGTDTLSDMLNYSESELRELFYITSQSVLNECSENLKNEKQTEVSMHDMATTLLCFFSDGQKYVAINIGDGLICRCREADDYEIILPPESRYYRNQTYYITDADAFEHINVVKSGFDAKSSYALMTDGACDCLYSHDSRTLAPLLFKFNEVHKSCENRRQADDIIYNAMRQLFPIRTDDDCALAIITLMD